MLDNFYIFVKKYKMAVLRLKEIMNLKGISRDELANKVDVSPTTISNISSEKNLPTIHLLLKIAEALDVDIRELFVPTKGSLISQTEVDEAKVLLEKGLDILKGNK
jgi:transcriptional regulator with XRE-family HTH domain